MLVVVAGLGFAFVGQIEALYTIFQKADGKQVYAKVFLEDDRGSFTLQDGSNTTGTLSEVRYGVNVRKRLGGMTTATVGRWDLDGKTGYFVFRALDSKGRMEGYWGYNQRGASGPAVGSWNGVHMQHQSTPSAIELPKAVPAAGDPKKGREVVVVNEPFSKLVTVRFPIIQCVKTRAGFFAETIDHLYIAVVGLRINTANGVTKATEPIHARLPATDNYYVYSSGSSNSRRGARNTTLPEPVAWTGRLGDGEVVFLSFVFADQQNTKSQDFLRTLGTIGKYTGEAGALAIGNEDLRHVVSKSGKELLDNVERGDYPLGQLSIKIENKLGAIKMELQGGVEYGKATSSSATTQFFELSGKRNDSKYLAAISADVE